MSPRFVLLKARQFADLIVQEHLKTKAFVAMPKITSAWLARWKKDKGIVFRKPNPRSKASRPVLLERVRATWCNLLRVRYLASKTIGSDLSEVVYGVDEEPIHFNESGSKAARICFARFTAARPSLPGISGTTLWVGGCYSTVQ